MLKLKMVDGSKTVELEMDLSDDLQRRAVINGAFGMFGVTPIVINNVPRPASPTVTQEQKPEVNVSKDIVIQQNFGSKVDLELKKQLEIEKARSEVSSRPRQVQFINSERSLSVPLSEKLAEKLEDKPDWFETGVKVKEDVPHYRCRYWCKNPQCKNQGNHYVLETEKTINCHNCNSSLKIRPATREAFPARDEFGNYFRADELV